MNNEIIKAAGKKDIVFNVDPDYEGIFGIKNQKGKSLLQEKVIFNEEYRRSPKHYKKSNRKITNSVEKNYEVCNLYKSIN